MSDDNARDAASLAVEHFTELVQILDKALTKATLIGDRELVERLARAKGAAEHSKELLDRLCNPVPSDDESTH